MSISYAFYVFRIVRVIYCVRDVSVMCQWPMALYHK